MKAESRSGSRGPRDFLGTHPFAKKRRGVGKRETLLSAPLVDALETLAKPT